MKKILFVCTGNICRSSSAEAIARNMVKSRSMQDSMKFNSVGTSGFHQGELSDRRAIMVAKENGVSFDGIFAKKIEERDIIDHDIILCMDRSHLDKVKRFAKNCYHHKIHLFLEYAALENNFKDEVFDPYYHDDDAFVEVFDLIKLGVHGVIQKVIFES